MPEKKSGLPRPGVATPCQYELVTGLQPVSVQRPGSRALAGALATSVRARPSAASRSGFTRSADDEDVARRDLLVEVVHDGQHAAVLAALQPPQGERVRPGIDAAELDGAPRRPPERVPDGRRLVQQEADLRALAGALGLEPAAPG